MTQQPTLRPVDVAVAVALARGPEQSYGDLAGCLHLSRGAVHGGVRRLQAADLLLPGSRRAHGRNLREFLFSGLRYAFYAVRGPVTRGVPTAHSAPPLAGEIVSDEVLVWPSADGEARGESVTPLYPGATRLAFTDPALYRALALLDAVRIGQVRERKRAKELLDGLLNPVEAA